MRSGFCEHGIDAALCRLPECSSNRLTRREMEVAGLIALGLTNREIAGRIGAAEDTVKKHTSTILLKAHLDNRTEVARWWLLRDVGLSEKAAPGLADSRPLVVAVAAVVIEGVLLALAVGIIAGSLLGGAR